MDILEHMFTHIKEYLIIKLVDYCNFGQSDRHFRLTVIPGWKRLRKARIYQCIFKWLVSWMPPPKRPCVFFRCKVQNVFYFLLKRTKCFFIAQLTSNEMTCVRCRLDHHSICYRDVCFGKWTFHLIEAIIFHWLLAR